jgi:hypothetical protein
LPRLSRDCSNLTHRSSSPHGTDWQVVHSVVTGVEEADVASAMALEEVWHALTDFDSYGAWNTFTTAVATTTTTTMTQPQQAAAAAAAAASAPPPRPGQAVALTVALGLPWPLSVLDSAYTSTLQLDFQWLEFNASAKRMCWGIRNGPPAMTSERGETEGRTVKSAAKQQLISLLDALLISHRCAELQVQMVETINSTCSTSSASSSNSDSQVVVQVRIRHSDENIGAVAPLVGVLYKQAIEAGFARMTRDLAAYMVAASSTSANRSGAQ